MIRSAGAYRMRLVTDLRDTARTASLAHDQVGSGPPLVLLHGLGGERHVWAPVLDALAAHRTLIVPDLPGFGASPALPSAIKPTPAVLASVVADLLDELGLGAPDVAGNSLGGWVALELALRRRARTVTALCPAGFWSRPLGPRRDTALKTARALRGLVPALTHVGPLRRAALGGVIAHPERVPPRDAARMIGAYASAPGFAAVNAAMRAGRFARIADVPVPVTVAWGERDRLVSPPRELPIGVRSLLLPGCGHLPMWDDPGLVTQVILTQAA